MTNVMNFRQSLYFTIFPIRSFWSAPLNRAKWFRNRWLGNMLLYYIVKKNWFTLIHVQLISWFCTLVNLSCLHFVDIPLRLILTKVDLLELCGNGDLSGIFRSKHVEQKVNIAKEEFDLQDCQILPIANYVTGTEKQLYQDILALLTMDNILEEALTYIKNEIN